MKRDPDELIREVDKLYQVRSEDAKWRALAWLCFKVSCVTLTVVYTILMALAARTLLVELLTR